MTHPDGHGVVPHDEAFHEAEREAAAAHAAAHDPGLQAPPAHPAHVHAPGPGGSPVAADAPEILRLTGLEVHFPVRGGLFDILTRRTRGVVRAVDGIDLSIRKGEILALVGESGSGKTTTGRVVVKLTRQTGGTVTVDGKDVSALWGTRALRAYRRRVQLIFQDPYETLNPKHTVGEFVMEPLIVNNIGVRHERMGVALAALDAAGLRPAADYASRYPHELSGGQRQRVVIAGALVMNPELVVADEPVSMLDVSIRTELLRLMLDLRRERGLTYLFITHDLSIAWVLADRIAVMYLGKIMEIGPAEQVIRTPRNPYTQALVSVSPSPDPPAAGARAARTILVGETPDAAHVPSGCRFHPRCPLAFDRCTVEEPPLFEVGDGHQAACWLAEAGPLDLPVIDAVQAVGGSEVAAVEAGVAADTPS
ncbi:MAG TPA: ABC transporter ATP-binding protein [Candidatus Limnocylindrales bacterium]